MTIAAEHGTDEALTDGTFTDEELTALALAADPETPVAADATPWLPERDSTLPASYLPAASRRSRPGSPARTLAVTLVIAAFLIVTASGFCVTYGQLVHA